MNIRNIQLKGTGIVKNEESIDYDAGVKSNPMADIADEGEAGLAEKESDTELAIMEATDKGVNEIAKEEDKRFIDIAKASVDELLPPSNRPGFDDSVIQDAKTDHAIEGGITKPKTTGPMKYNGDAASEGGMIRKTPAVNTADNAYEVSGFFIETPSPSGVGMISEQVNQNFPDLETAKMSIQGQTYLKPLPSGGFKACRIIRGGPIICLNERQVFEYIDEKWRKP